MHGFQVLSSDISFMYLFVVRERTLLIANICIAVNYYHMLPVLYVSLQSTSEMSIGWDLFITMGAGTMSEGWSRYLFDFVN